MHIFVSDIIHAVLLGTKSQIALLVDPYFGRLKRPNQYPLSDVELPVLYYQRILYVFLDDKLNVFIECIVEDVLESDVAFNSPSSR